MSQNQKHFMFLLDILETGGIQRQLLYVVKALIQRGDRCTVLSLHSQNPAMQKAYENAGASIILYKKKRRLDFSLISFLKEKFTTYRPDLVHAMTLQTAFWASMAFPKNNAPAFVSSWLNTHKLRTLSSRFIDNNFVAPKVDAVFVNSNQGAKLYRKHTNGRTPIWRIYNGVEENQHSPENARQFMHVKHDDFVVGCVGRLVPVKRHADAIKAVSLLKEKGHEIKLVLVGNGPLSKELKVFSKSLGVTDNVIFLGEQNKPEEIISGFDVLLMPSESEGFPNTLLEGMAAKKPCIATKVGGVPEAVVDGESCLLIPPKSPDKIAEKILQLIADPILRQKIAARGFETAKERFSIGQLQKKMIAHYDDLITTQAAKVAYVISMFPKISENFILREVDELKQRGILNCVVSLKQPNEKVLHQQARRLKKHTLLQPWISPAVIISNAKTLIRHPILYTKTLSKFLYIHRTNPKEMAKAQVVWPKLVAFAEVLKQRGITQVHGQWANIPTACAYALSQLLGVKFSFTAHAHDIYIHNTGLLDKLLSADFVATCTQRNVVHLRSLVSSQADKDKIHLCRHFIKLPPQPTKHIPQSPPLILSIGTLLPYKGFNLLLEAVNRLKKMGIAFQLRIIGDGPLKNELLDHRNKLGLEKEVTFLGQCPQEMVFKELERTAVFCLASRRTVGEREDNLPNVLLEAGFFSVPPIGSNLGSIGEFIRHNENGLMVEPDNLDDLTLNLELLMRDEALRMKLGKQAQKDAPLLFGLEKNAGILENLFRQSLKMNG